MFISRNLLNASKHQETILLRRSHSLSWQIIQYIETHHCSRHLLLTVVFVSVACLSVWSPLKLLNRHNEVWYVAEGQPICTDPQEPTPAHTPRPAQTGSPTDSASEPLPHTLSDSPALSPANLSSNTTSNSSQTPSDTPALPPSDAPPSPSSDMLADAPFSHTPTTAQIPLDATTNSSDLVSVSPSLEPQSDAGLWNSTAHSSPDTDSHPKVEPDDAH